MTILLPAENVMRFVGPLLGNFSSAAVVSVVVWTLLFGMGAMALFRRDTARV